ncbi:O-antigen ligase family protein [Vibrio sp. WXL103]|uniref:O-antigen ligase family protein n=1 Tax=Vibrio sp. WXL103 TaxID=3450710 RepID=UPI003EC63F41
MTMLVWSLVAFLWLIKTVLVSIESITVGIIIPVIIDVLIMLMVFGSKIFWDKLNKSGVIKNLILLNLILLFFVVIAYANQYSLFISIATYIRLLTCQCIFLFGCVSYSIVKARKWFIVIVAFSVLLHLFAGILGPFIYLGGEEIDGIMRYSGLAGKVNILANFALFFSVLFYVFYDSSKKSIYLFLFILSVSVVFVTGTVKNALIVVFIVSYLSLIKSNKKIFIIPLFLVVLVPVGFYVFQSTSISERVSEFVETGISVNIERGEKVGNSLNWRLLHWRILLSNWYTDHFWFGTGLGQYAELEALTTQSGITFDPHNDWLKVLLEVGVVGFLSFGYFIFRLFKFTARLSREDLLAKGLLYAYGASLLAMLSANVIYSLPIFYYFWALLGFSYYRTLNN